MLFSPTNRKLSGDMSFIYSTVIREKRFVDSNLQIKKKFNLMESSCKSIVIN